MPEYDYDLFTIGAGSGGVRASRFAAGFGARAAVAEERNLGGTCVNVGCIPKKLFAYASHFSEDFEDAAGFGWTVGERRFDWSTLVANKDREISRLNGIYDRMLKAAGVEIFESRARIVDPHTIEVGGKTVTADYILVATGGWPVVPDIPGKEFAITSNEAFYLDELPEKILIVGGGYIAVEFAGIFNGLGVDVTQLYRGPHFLRGFDDDVRHYLADEMRKKGVDLQFNQNVACIERAERGFTAMLENGREIAADTVMYCTGRAPFSQGIGLEEAGVELRASGAVKVDEHFRTSVPSIFAIGDVIDRMQLTPVALEEGTAVANALFNKNAAAVDYENVPTAVFSQPNIGTVGLTEAEARERYGPVRIFVSEFKALKHTLTASEERTFMKLIVHRGDDRVLGCHMVGPDAGEIVQGIAIALKCGATKAQFDATIGIHPTAAEEFVTMREPIPDEVDAAAD
ncbi:MAG: glutathione-disulfide reductase [Alphaproteobacteria bacterium]|nr:glutathione-disulfide reductase [Alphaproteobacteria bacterium]